MPSSTGHSPGLRSNSNLLAPGTELAWPKILLGWLFDKEHSDDSGLRFPENVERNSALLNLQIGRTNIRNGASHFKINPLQKAVQTQNCSKSGIIYPIRNNGKCYIITTVIKFDINNYPS